MPKKPDLISGALCFWLNKILLFSAKSLSTSMGCSAKKYTQSPQINIYSRFKVSLFLFGNLNCATIKSLFRYKKF